MRPMAKDLNGTERIGKYGLSLPLDHDGSVEPPGVSDPPFPAT
jgi:hypothetical protein